MNLIFNAHTYQFGLFSSSIILLASAFFLCIPDLPSNLESLETVQTSSVLISWNWQCWEKKNRPIPLGPTRSEPSTICLNALKGRQNVPSARFVYIQ